MMVNKWVLGLSSCSLLGYNDLWGDVNSSGAHFIRAYMAYNHAMGESFRSNQKFNLMNLGCESSVLVT